MDVDLSQGLKGRRILVVDDDYLVAQTIVDLLEEAGAEILGPIGSVAEALAFIAANAGAFNCAVLDVNLRGTPSYPIADALIERNIPFAFATGYGGETIEARYRHHPRCEKPFNQRTLVQALMVRVQA